MKRKNKSRLVMFILMCVALNINAQPSYELRTGLNLNTRNSPLYKPINEGDNTPYKLGYQAGILVNFSSTQKLNYQTGLEYINKKSSYERQNFSNWNPGISDITETSIHYLEIPFCALYEIKKINFLFGGYTAFGLSGNSSITDSNGTNEVKLSPNYGKVSIDDEDSYFRGFDLGLRVGAAYEISSFRFYLLYSYGLISTTPVFEGQESASGLSLMNKTISLSVGYIIN